MIPSDLLSQLVCPETKDSLSLADSQTLDILNQKITEGQLQNRAGLSISDPIEQGLVRADKQWVYPIRQGIPVMLIDEALPLS